ncbi:MAG: hypothetical protein B6D65_02535 [candidate division Zixibacteria bacterium 4484_93]|nr:MAG: hypothetical protein B6D65_02535 [candidate division Zixibacteria bacterium 4484_93]
MKPIFWFILAIIVIGVALNLLTKGKKGEIKEKARVKSTESQSKAYQIEAKELAKYICVKEQAFFAKNGHFTASKDSLQFVMGMSHYKFDIVSATEFGFKAKIYGNIDNDRVVDTWFVDQDGNLEHTIDDAIR